MTFEEIIVQLENNVPVIRSLTENMTQAQASWKADPERWSVLEIINHINDIEVEDFRHCLDLVLFHPDTEWPSFDETAWITERSYNGRNFQDSIHEFVHERAITLRWLAELESPDMNATHSGTGFSGDPMRAGDLMLAWAVHDLFHIQQLALLKRDILSEWGKPFSPAYSGFSV
ncbi:MAG: DinB family protein [Spirochaetota bacterium]